MNAGTGSDTVNTTSDFYNNFNANLAVQGAVNVLPLHALGVGTLATTEGATLNQTVATFQDPNGAGASGDYSATIGWGDNTSATTTSISGPDANGYFTVSGSHVYASANTAGNTVSVTVHRAGVADVTVSDTATVADATLSGAAASITATAGATFTGAVATFTDGNAAAKAGDFTATIDWGDGSITAGSVTAAGGKFQVNGSHVYAAAGDEKITAVVKDVGGSVATIASAATVAAALTPHERYVTAVYEDVLGRLPEPAGLAYWANLLDQGTAVGSVAKAIAHSPEYYGKFVIAPDYLKLLGRAADANDIAFWTAKMQGGLTDQQLEAEFIAADEFFGKAGDTDLDWVDQVYQILLGRPAQPTDETFWTGRLTAGQSRLLVADQIAASRENGSQLIEADYQKYLGRAADPDGLVYWINQLAAGETNEDIIAGFTGSPEYYKEHTS